MKLVGKLEALWNADLRRYTPIYLRGLPFAQALPSAALALKDLAGAKPSNGCSGYDRGLALPDATTTDDLTEKLFKVAKHLSDRGEARPLTGEAYPVRHWSGGHLLGTVDRAASLALGIQTYGVQLTGYVRQGGGLFMWVAKRAHNRNYFKGALDNLVGGGQPAELSSWENLEKEGWEEAGLDKERLQSASWAGRLAYRFDGPEGLVSSVMDVYDLEVSRDWEPHNKDGGVESFSLRSLDDVASLVRDTDSFKFNAGLVVIDFLFRQGAFASLPFGEQRLIGDWLRRPDPQDPHELKKGDFP